MPLYVDLDGTLFLGDTLHESVLLLLRRNPLNLFRMLMWLLQGKLAFKRHVANAVLPDATTLPYHAAFLQHLRDEHARGRTLVLASAADDRIVRAVAQHLGLFSAALGSVNVNLSGANKLAAIQQHNGGRPFAYAGNGRSDLPVWQGSAEALVVNAPGAVQRQALLQHPQALVFERQAPGIKTVLKAIRISQWSKNALLFVPMLAGHLRSPQAWLDTTLAFVAFGLCASATYLVNDLLDLPVDRVHQHKRARPLASGRLSITSAGLLVVLLPVLGFALAATVSWALVVMLLGYITITVSYSFWLKGKELVDVLTLATLYTWRLVTGALVAHVMPSNWLMAFSMFLFLSLALVKRCAELEEMVDSTRTITPGRGYRLVDLPTLRGDGAHAVHRQPERQSTVPAFHLAVGLGAADADLDHAHLAESSAA